MEQVSAAPAPGVLARTLGLRPGEGPALALAFACFFSLLSGYYMLRSVRDAMIAADGTRLIPTVFTSVFVCMLLLKPVYGAVVSRATTRTRRRAKPSTRRCPAGSTNGCKASVSKRWSPTAT